MYDNGVEVPHCDVMTISPIFFVVNYFHHHLRLLSNQCLVNVNLSQGLVHRESVQLQGLGTFCHLLSSANITL